MGDGADLEKNRAGLALRTTESIYIYYWRIVMCVEKANQSMATICMSWLLVNCWGQSYLHLKKHLVSMLVSVNALVADMQRTNWHSNLQSASCHKEHLLESTSTGTSTRKATAQTFVSTSTSLTADRFHFACSEGVCEEPSPVWYKFSSVKHRLRIWTKCCKCWIILRIFEALCWYFCTRGSVQVSPFLDTHCL